MIKGVTHAHLGPIWYHSDDEGEVLTLQMSVNGRLPIWLIFMQAVFRQSIILKTVINFARFFPHFLDSPSIHLPQLINGKNDLNFSLPYTILHSVLSINLN